MSFRPYLPWTKSSKQKQKEKQQKKKKNSSHASSQMQQDYEQSFEKAKAIHNFQVMKKHLSSRHNTRSSRYQSEASSGDLQPVEGGAHHSLVRTETIVTQEDPVPMPKPMKLGEYSRRQAGRSVEGHSVSQSMSSLASMSFSHLGPAKANQEHLVRHVFLYYNKTSAPNNKMANKSFEVSHCPLNKEVTDIAEAYGLNRGESELSGFEDEDEDEDDALQVVHTTEPIVDQAEDVMKSYLEELNVEEDYVEKTVEDVRNAKGDEQLLAECYERVDQFVDQERSVHQTDAQQESKIEEKASNIEEVVVKLEKAAPGRLVQSNDAGWINEDLLRPKFQRHVSSTLEHLRTRQVEHGIKKLVKMFSKKNV